MAPYYEDESVVIYHGDAMAIWETLPPADLLLTDPPYNVVNRDDEGLRTLDRGEADSLPADPARVAFRATKMTTGSAYIFCGTEQVSELRRVMVEGGMSTRTGVWHKSNPSPMNGEVIWLSALELCVFGRHPKATFNRHCKAPIWHGPSEPRDDHPTAKPLWLFKELILASSKERDLVVDPFMGSGTTLRAAKDLGRRAIGIELSEAYCEIAAKRLGQGVLDFGAAS